MQVTETLADGLKREFRVVIPQTELESRLNERLNELKGRVRINGFRPGKVPVDHLKRVYGRSVMAETIESSVQEANAKIIADHNLRLAMQPKVKLPEEQAEVEAVVAGKSDLAFTVAVEIVPTIKLGNFSGIKLERPVATISDKDVDEALHNIAQQNRPYSAKAADAGAAADDRVTINFTGSIDGVPFEGGTGEDVVVQIGSGTFIPGFEDQLIGAKAGETRTVNVTFPENYGASHLAGKAASFEVVVKSIETPGEVTVTEDFAKSLGLESLDKLKAAVRERIQRDQSGVSRQRLKRQLLDRLDEMHKFDAPPTLVEEEFANVWSSVESDLKSRGATFADEGTNEEAARDEYRKIADRRVRLGLLLAEIGERNNIKVTDEEVSRAIVEQARQMPGREREVWDYYNKNPNALASLRAPIYEEKVVDFLVELADVTDRPVSREELFKEDVEQQPAG